ncbi:hypothetical protein [Anaerotignum sp.]|uniref:hypothetical protein n=1 Tax=Anaerotignum sp. TaxID=2039241 RepID=UPI0028B25BA8|nr:hypothetical protein [Anaerotignum sp.]
MGAKDENLTLNQVDENLDDFESLFLTNYVFEDEFEDSFNEEKPLETPPLIKYEKEEVSKSVLTPEEVKDKFDILARKKQLSDYEITDTKIILKNEFGETLHSFDLKTDEDYENRRNSIYYLHQYRVTLVFLFLCLPFVLVFISYIKKFGFLRFLASLPLTIFLAIIPSFLFLGVIIAVPHALGWEHIKEIPMRKIILVSIIVFIVAAILLFFSPII